MNISESIVIELLNQIFEIEKKIKASNFENSLYRNLRRMKQPFEDFGYRCYDPLGEKYFFNRPDCELTGSGDEGDESLIVEVIKPVILHEAQGENRIVQKAVVKTDAR